MDWLLASLFNLQTILGFAIIGLVILLFIGKQRRPYLYPPGPMRLPLIGNLHQLGSSPHETFMKMRKTYGDIFAIDFAGQPGIVLNEHKMIKEAFSKPEFCGRPVLYPFLERSGGDKMRGIILNEGTAWQEQRRFIMKTLRDFGFGKRSMESLIQTEITELIRNMLKLEGQPFQTQNVFNLAVVNSLWSIITGKRFSHDDTKLLHLVQYITEGIGEGGSGAAMLFFPIICKLAPGISGYNKFMDHQFKTMDLIREEIIERKSIFQQEDARDVVDAQMEEIRKTTDPNSSFFQVEGERNLIVTLSDLFVAGLETTSTTISWSILYLSLHPDIQDKLYTEIKNVVGTSRLPSLTDRPEMYYTEAIIYEILRMSSLAPLALFHRTTADVSFYGYEIPKHTLIVSNLYGVHKDPAIWGDPDVFRPERFIGLDGRLNKAHEKVMAFSTGKRVCLGESLAKDELFLFISSIFQRFSFTPNPAKPKPSTEPNISMALLPKPYEVILTER